ncbi:hypothetical protein [Absidia glauca]|uniref:DASH complex subunit DAD1 n=1 Tax=Absidia glauca TaxID=4829 RepID=A0A168LQM5_ABSGL|nr:hypothetical protein [Absidia glauca]
MSSTFEKERDKLMEGVSHGLQQILSGLDDLNRNLESVNTIGLEFEAPAKVWQQFHTFVMPPDEAPPEEQQQQQQNDSRKSSQSVSSLPSQLLTDTNSTRSIRTPH